MGAGGMEGQATDCFMDPKEISQVLETKWNSFLKCCYRR